MLLLQADGDLILDRQGVEQLAACAPQKLTLFLMRTSSSDLTETSERSSSDMVGDVDKGRWMDCGEDDCTSTCLHQGRY